MPTFFRVLGRGDSSVRRPAWGTPRWMSLKRVDRERDFAQAPGESTLADDLRGEGERADMSVALQ